MSSQTEQHQAHWRPEVLTEERQREFVLSLIPIDGFKTARRDVIQLFEHTYSEIEEVKESFSEKSNSELQDWALEPYSNGPEYDPHSAVMGIVSALNRFKTELKWLCTILLFIANVVSVEWFRTLGKGGFEALELVEGTIPLSIITLGILYVWSLRVDTFAHQTLNHELRVGKMKVMTRDRSQIVGYGIWNRSLHGQSGLLLVTFFYLLQSLPKLPLLGRLFDDPVQFVKAMFIQNIEMFYETNSWLKAGKQLYGRYR